jgi:hypothetical protein
MLLLILISGCEREYSYEGGDPVVIDPIPVPIPDQPAWMCASCINQDRFTESKWSFFNDNKIICGISDTARVNAERTFFTFFGPSACSIDTGMVIGVYLNEVLDKDQYNIISRYASFYHYDNVGQTDIHISRVGFPFTVRIESYIHQTRTATGTFNGPVFTANGDSSYINFGKFKVKLF